MYNFTILERMILESIRKSEKTIEQIQEDTAMESHICANVVQSLLAKSLVSTKSNKFTLNKNLNAQIIEELQNKKNQTVEMNALVRECIQGSLLRGESTFQFMKVYMSEEEKKILNAMLYNIETFIDGLKKNKGKTKDETFIFWGGDTYAKAVTHYLN